MIWIIGEVLIWMFSPRKVKYEIPCINLKRRLPNEVFIGFYTGNLVFKIEHKKMGKEFLFLLDTVKYEPCSGFIDILVIMLLHLHLQPFEEYNKQDFLIYKKIIFDNVSGNLYYKEFNTLCPYAYRYNHKIIPEFIRSRYDRETANNVQFWNTIQRKFNIPNEIIFNIHGYITEDLSSITKILNDRHFMHFYYTNMIISLS